MLDAVRSEVTRGVHFPSKTYDSFAAADVSHCKKSCEVPCSRVPLARHVRAAVASGGSPGACLRAVATLRSPPGTSRPSACPAQADRSCGTWAFGKCFGGEGLQAALLTVHRIQQRAHSQTSYL